MHLGATPFSVYNTTGPRADRLPVHQRRQPGRGLRGRSSPTGWPPPAGKVEHIVCVDGGPGGRSRWTTLEARAEAGFDFDAAWRAVSPEDVLTLIYTSGTTGPPKGVELTHANMLAEIAASSSVLPVTSGDRIPPTCPRPTSPTGGRRTTSRWSSALQVTCVADIQHHRRRAGRRPAHDLGRRAPGLGEDQGRHRSPHRHRGRPAAPTRRLQWAVATGIQQGAGRAGGHQRRGPGPDAALLAEYAGPTSWSCPSARQARSRPGAAGRCRGRRPRPVDVLEFFGALGLPICELWGMSELSCCATVNPPDRIKIGTVGTALPGVELALADDGELLCRGPLVMRGYRNDPEKHRRGDRRRGLAAHRRRGHHRRRRLRPHRRPQEGTDHQRRRQEHVPGQHREQLKSACPLIGQAVAIGDRRPYNVALIVLDPDALAAFAAKHGLADASPAALARTRPS